MDRVQGVALSHLIVPGQSGPACRPEGSRNAANPAQSRRRRAWASFRDLVPVRMSVHATHSGSVPCPPRSTGPGALPLRTGARICVARSDQPDARSCRCEQVRYAHVYAELLICIRDQQYSGRHVAENWYPGLGGPIRFGADSVNMRTSRLACNMRTSRLACRTSGSVRFSAPMVRPFGASSIRADVLLLSDARAVPAQQDSRPTMSLA